MNNNYYTICASLHLVHGLFTYYINLFAYCREMTNTVESKIRNYHSKIVSNSFTGKVITGDFSAL